MHSIFRLKRMIFVLALFLSVTNILSAQTYNVSSPDNQLKVTIDAAPLLQYSISYNNTSVVSPSAISMNFDNGIVAGVNGTVANATTRTVNDVITVLFGKNKTLSDNFNELRISYNQNYDIVFRVYNDGVAYRFITSFSNSAVIVNSEQAVCNFADAPQVYFPEATTLDHWEKSYTIYSSLNSLAESQYCVIPVLFNNPANNYKLVITEADNYDYPGLYIQKNGNNSVKGMWAQYPDSVDQPDNVYSNHFPVTRFNYLAKTVGSRNYPWRVFIFFFTR